MKTAQIDKTTKTHAPAARGAQRVVVMNNSKLYEVHDGTSWVVVRVSEPGALQKGIYEGGAA
jgi:hypothetical protein